MDSGTLQRPSVTTALGNLGLRLLLSVLILFLGDLALILHLLPGAWDAASTGWLLAGEVALAALVFAVLFPLHVLALGLYRGLLRLFHRPALALFVACLPLIFVGWSLGKALFSGPAARAMALAPLAPYLGAIALFFGFWVIFVLSRWLLARSRPLVILTGLGTLAAALGLLVTDRLILPGLYHPIHWLQQALALLLLQLSLAALLPPGNRRTARSGLILWVLALPVALLLVFPTTRRPLAPALSQFVSWGSLSRYTAEYLVSVWPDPVASDFFAYLADLPEENTIPDPYVPTPPERLAEFKRNLPPGPLNFMLVVVDALRADQLRAFGSTKPRKRSLTPNLDRFAAKSFRFPDTMSQASSTAHSIPSLFSSQVVIPGSEMRFPTLISLFNQIGYHTFGALPQYFHLTPHAHEKYINEGFWRVEYTEKNTRVDFEASVKELLEEETQSPFFAYIHFYQLHLEYYTPPGYTHPYRGFKRLSKYDKATLYADEVFGRMIEQMRKQGLLENTIIVVTADHGEAFMEHGKRGHTTSCYWEQVQVPMILYIPGLKGGKTRAHTGNIDILPTVAELFDLPDREHFLGRSLIPLMMGKDTQKDRTYFARSGGGKSRAIRDSRYKLIYTGKTLQLFDLRHDPGELRDIYSPESPVAKRLMLELYQVFPDIWKQMLGKLDEATFQNALDLARSAPSPRARRLAALLLNQHTGAIKGRHTDELIALYNAENSPPVRIALAALLDIQSGKPGQDALKQRFQQSQGRERYETAFVLAQHRSSQHDRLFLDLLNDPNEDMALRRLAAESIRDKSAAEVAAAYLALTAESHPPVLRVVAIKALREMNGEKIERHLQDLQNDPDYKVRYTASESLGYHPGSADFLLRRYRTESHPLVRRGLLVALAQVRAPQAFALCEEALADRMMIVPAIYGFAKLGDKRALPLLQKVASTYDNRWTRKLARQTVRELRSAKR